MSFANISVFSQCVFLACSVCYKFNTLVSGRIVCWSRPSGYFFDQQLESIYVCLPACLCAFCLSHKINALVKWFKMCILTADRWSSGLLNYILIQSSVYSALQRNRSLQWNWNCAAFLIIKTSALAFAFGWVCMLLLFCSRCFIRQMSSVIYI